MNTEAKVGAFTILGIGLLLAAIVGLKGFSFGSDKDYTIYVGFHQVIGVLPQSGVRLSGVPVGKVVEIANDGGGVTVTLGIDKSTKIPADSVVTIGSSGVMGEKFINILPNSTARGYLQNGDYIYGFDEEGMDQVFAKMSGALTEVQSMMSNINDVIGDAQLKDSLKAISQNMAEASQHINGLTDSLETMTLENQSDVRGIVRNMNDATAAMGRTMNSIENMMANLNAVAGDPTTAENLRQTLQNIKDTSDKIAHMSENMDKALGDPEVAQDLKTTIHNAKELSGKADRMLGKLSSVKVEPTADILYSGKKDDFKVNLNVDIGADEGAFLAVGVDDVGDGNKVNAQVGSRSGEFAGRGGVINSKFGIGADYYAGKSWKFSADAYDPDDVTLRLRAEYALNHDSGTYLLGELNDVTRRSNRTAYFGLRQKF